MVDVVDKNTRSRMMAGIRGRNTKPEMKLRSALHALGLRFRLHVKELPGKPDIVLPRHRTVILVHGCFWHRHEGCRFATTPATRPDFWMSKFEQNVARDKKNSAFLLQGGWRLGVVWECAIRLKGERLIAREVDDWLHSSMICGEFSGSDEPVVDQTSQPLVDCQTMLG